MESIYYMLFCTFLTVSTVSLPISNDQEMTNQGKTDGLLIKREIVAGDKLLNRIDGDLADFENVEQKQNNSDESLSTSEARYRPYFRFRRISSNKLTQPKYLSNYASDRDRFPTTF
ncbi:hypothetical protein JTB14_011892 [Gonioctena quinquepunctata]|nr:hypothetical protein JTB14_011892 [Gonioctena quinquepunctata]